MDRTARPSLSLNILTPPDSTGSPSLMYVEVSSPPPSEPLYFVSVYGRIKRESNGLRAASDKVTAALCTLFITDQHRSLESVRTSLAESIYDQLSTSPGDAITFSYKCFAYDLIQPVIHFEFERTFNLADQSEFSITLDMTCDLLSHKLPDYICVPRVPRPSSVAWNKLFATIWAQLGQKVIHLTRIQETAIPDFTPSSSSETTFIQVGSLVTPPPWCPILHHSTSTSSSSSSCSSDLPVSPVDSV